MMASRAWAVYCLLGAACFACSANALSIAPAGPKQYVTFIASEGGVTAQHPDVEKEAVGSTAVYRTDLKEGGKTVGSIVWTGTYIDHNAAHYLVHCDITEGKYKGALVGSGIGGGVYNSGPTTVIVSGGTGAFESATGTITWGNPGGRSNDGGVYYTFKLALAPTGGSSNNVQTEAAAKSG